MNELEFDSSKNNYIKNMTSETYYKLLEWEMAIGLQEVDNLKPSEYFKNIIEDNLNSDKTVYEIELDLKNYYDKKIKKMI